MVTMLTPASEVELAAMVATAARTATPLQVLGGGTRAIAAAPVDAKARLTTRAMQGITLYEPAALTIAARAGTPVRDVIDALASEGQHLPFEPADWRTLLGTQGEPTIGGMAASAAAGPRRIQAGSVRDSAIGVRFIDGAGTIVKNGGRVMKNVTGYDLVKLMCGSFGTLGVLSEITFKVLPKPESMTTLILHGLSVERAVGVLSAALTAPFDVNGAAHEGAGEGARTYVRIEGFETSLVYRAAQLQALLAPFGEAHLERDPQANARIWQGIRDVEAFGATPGAVWKISVQPSAAPALLERIGAAMDVRPMLDWGGGLIWLLVPDESDAGASIIRGALASTGGHATLMRSALATPAPVFQPLAPAIEALSQRLRRQFDPHAILNAGMMPGVM
jgi:glycolate oxidase FAD binding subunit